MADESNPVGKSVEASLLLDFYGSLLPERLRRLMEFHFYEDLSYGEIAEQTGITRQAVHDGVSRGLARLTAYEAKLALIQRFRNQKERVERTIRLLKENREAEASRELDSLLEEL